MIENLYIVIPVHNRIKLTFKCLESLFTQTVEGFKVVVIDDGSTDGTSNMINNAFPQVILLHGDGNLWWTRATNLGVEYALECGAEYVMTLNDDVIATNGFVEKMMIWAEREPKALLGALSVDIFDENPVYGGEIINWKFASSTKLLDILESNQLCGIHEVTHFPGRGLLIPSGVFNQIGFFDEKNFPQTIADYDFTHKAYRSGYKVYCNYDAKILLYRDSIGVSLYREKKDLKNYYNYLFGKKSGANVIKFFSFSIKNCPKRYLPLFLPIGLARRVFGYQLEWLREILITQQYPADSKNDATPESVKETTNESEYP